MAGTSLIRRHLSLISNHGDTGGNLLDLAEARRRRDMMDEFTPLTDLLYDEPTPGDGRLLRRINDDDQRVAPDDIHPLARHLLGQRSPTTGERIDTPEVLALGDLVARTGGTRLAMLQIGRSWAASALYPDRNQASPAKPTPSQAARALAASILLTLDCPRCDQPIVPDGVRRRRDLRVCVWRRAYARWEAGC